MIPRSCLMLASRLLCIRSEVPGRLEKPSRQNMRKPHKKEAAP